MGILPEGAVRPDDLSRLTVSYTCGDGDRIEIRAQETGGILVHSLTLEEAGAFLSGGQDRQVLGVAVAARILFGGAA